MDVVKHDLLTGVRLSTSDASLEAVDVRDSAGVDERSLQRRARDWNACSVDG